VGPNEVQVFEAKVHHGARYRADVEAILGLDKNYMQLFGEFGVRKHGVGGIVYYVGSLGQSNRVRGCVQTRWPMLTGI
jgi:hypothetical protein